MATGTWAIRRIQTGQQTIPSIASCGPGTQLVGVYLREVTSGQLAIISVCVNPTVTACAAGGLLAAIGTAGYILADNPCGAERTEEPVVNGHKRA